MGGAAALIAGSQLQPPLAAVVSLSGETDPTELVGGIPLDAGAAVEHLRVPTMLVVAANDQYVSVGEPGRCTRQSRRVTSDCSPLPVGSAAGTASSC